jgi:hypothetical protein
MTAKPIRSATPGQIGALELKNRLVLPAICTNHTYQGDFIDAASNTRRHFVRARFRLNQERDWRWSLKSYSNP